MQKNIIVISHTGARENMSEGKCTLAQALRLCTGRTAHRGSRGIEVKLYSFITNGTRRGWGVSVTPWLLFTPGKDSVPTVQEAGWALGPVWTGAEKKVKCTLVHALRLCKGRTAHRGSRGMALLFHDHGTRRGWGVSVMPRPPFTLGKDPVPIVQEAGWAPGLVWTGAENLAPTGIRSPDRPARRQSLYSEVYTYIILIMHLISKNSLGSIKCEEFLN